MKALGKQKRKQNYILFGITGILSLLLVNNGYYITALHELNHAIAGFFVFQIPVSVRIGWYDGEIQQFGLATPITRTISATAGAGFAYTLPGLLFLIGRIFKYPGIAGIALFAGPQLIKDWGYGADFYGINHLWFWAAFHWFIAICVYLGVYYCIWEAQDATRGNDNNPKTGTVQRSKRIRSGIQRRNEGWERKPAYTSSIRGIIKPIR